MCISQYWFIVLYRYLGLNMVSVLCCAGVYFCLNMVMITMSTVLTTVVANMFYRGVRINRAPKWLRVVRTAPASVPMSSHTLKIYNEAR